MRFKIQLLGGIIALMFGMPSYAKVTQNCPCDDQKALFNDDAYNSYRKKFKTTPKNPVTKIDTGMYTPKYYQGYPYFGYYSFGSYTGRSLYF